MKVNLLSIGIILGMPFASFMMANPTTATTFNLTPLDLENGLTVSGTVTTDGTIGNLSASNFTDWNINVASFNEIIYNKNNTHPNTFLVTTDGQTITVDTSPEGGELGFYGGRRFQVQLANFTVPDFYPAFAFYTAGSNFQYLPFNPPSDGSPYVVAQASSPDSNIFNVIPLDFGNGITMSGTITTDGDLNQFNPVDWNIVVREVTVLRTFTQKNSRVLASDSVVTDGSTITVINSDGDNPGGSWAFGLPGFDPTIVQLADFTDPSILGGQAYYLTPFGYQGILSPLSSEPNYLAATVTSNPPTVPEPSMGIGIGSIGIILGSQSLLKRKSDR
jgi:hypothetical protein